MGSSLKWVIQFIQESKADSLYIHLASPSRQRAASQVRARSGPNPVLPIVSGCSCCRANRRLLWQVPHLCMPCALVSTPPTPFCFLYLPEPLRRRRAHILPSAPLAFSLRSMFSSLFSSRVQRAGTASAARHSPSLYAASFWLSMFSPCRSCMICLVLLSEKSASLTVCTTLAHTSTKPKSWGQVCL